MSKPTEGPYRIRPGTLNIEDAKGFLVACARSGQWHRSGGRKSKVPSPIIPREQAEANARLLAKSWEMRVSLVRVLRLVDNAKWRDPVGCPLETAPHIDEARALLAEIDGEDQ